MSSYLLDEVNHDQRSVSKDLDLLDRRAYVAMDSKKGDLIWALSDPIQVVLDVGVSNTELRIGDSSAHVRMYFGVDVWVDPEHGASDFSYGLASLNDVFEVKLRVYVHQNLVVHRQIDIFLSLAIPVEDHLAGLETSFKRHPDLISGYQNRSRAHLGQGS